MENFLRGTSINFLIFNFSLQEEKLLYNHPENQKLSFH